jgi:hypothetical protein
MDKFISFLFLKEIYINLIFVSMDIQAEKIELIKLIADIESEKVLKKIKGILKSEKKMDETDRILANPAMTKRLEESRRQFQDGKGVKISLDDIWK